MITAYSAPFVHAKGGVGDALGDGISTGVGFGAGGGGRNSEHAASVLTTATVTIPTATFRNMVNGGNLQ
jgi:hypothetical protein